MEKLKQKEDFLTYKPSDKFEKFLRSVDGDDFIRFLKRLVIYSEDNYSEIAKRVNWLLSRVGADYVEVVKDGNLIGDNGNYRVRIVDDNLETQRKEAGVWVKKGAAIA